MDVIAVGPMRAGSLLWQKEEGRFALTVVAKLTIALAPMRCEVATAQEDVNERENHWDDDPRRSLYAPSDLAPRKRRADVVLVGHAFAPQGKPSRAVLTRLSIGAVDKMIEVVGQRVLTRDGEVRDGPRWTRMPLRYERAAGGPGTWNPVGVSPDAPPDTYGQRVLPNLQPPGLAVTGPGEPVPPIGYGPLASSWPSRRERIGPGSQAWTEARIAEAPLPEDVDPLYFQVAPPDQQLDELHGDERLVLEHLHPEHARLATQLPGVRARAFVDVPGAMAIELPLAADTLWIDTDRALGTITWRGQLALARRDQPGRVVVAAEPAGQRLQWPAVRELIAQKGPDTLSIKDEATSPPAEVTIPGNVPAAVSALPFTAPTEASQASAAAPAEEVLHRPERSGPRSTVEVVVGENPALTPPWLAAQRTKPPAEAARAPEPPRPPEAPRFGSTPPPPVPARPPEAPRFGSVPPAPMPAMTASAPLPAPMMAPSAPVSVMMPSAPVPAPVSVMTPAAPMPPPLVTSSLAATPPAAPIATPRALEADGKSLAKATYAGTLAASNAAAGRGVAPRAPAPAQEKAAPAPEPAPEQPAAPPLELIWFDPDLAARLRATAAWAPLMKPPKKPAPQQRGAPPPPPEPPDASEKAVRADFAAVLSRGAPQSIAQIEAALGSALAGGGEPPLVLAAGDLELPLDEIELLKATIAAATPLAALDKKLKEVLDVASELLAGAAGAPEVVEGQLARIREAWTRANRLLPASYLETQPERVLLGQRRYQKRDLLDGTWIRALYQFGSGDAPVPAYVPESLEKKLPLFKSFAARAVFEALPQQDQYESHPLALRLVALARVVGARSRTPSRG